MNENIRCPNCDNENNPSSMFCVDCGFWLGDLHATTKKNWEMDVVFQEQYIKVLEEVQTFHLKADEYLLYFPDHQESLAFTKEQSIVLGRRTNSGVTGIHVVDLNKYEAAHLGVSRHHAQITHRDDTYYLADLESSNGTFLNGQRLHLGKQYPLKNGDVIILAHLPLTFHCFTKAKEVR